MKKFLVALTILSSVLTAQAQESSQLSCHEIYAHDLAIKTHKKERAQKIGSDIYTSSLILMWTGSLPLTAGAMLVGGSLALYGNMDSSAQKIDELQHEGSSRLVRLTKKMQRNINAHISEDEIISIIKDGLESGLFCENLPKLYSASKIKKHIRNVLELKYAVAQE